MTDTAEPAGQRSFRQRVEDHPIGLLAGVVVAAIGATLAIVAPVAQITVDNRAAALEQRMAERDVEHARSIAQLQGELEDVRRTSAQQIEDLKRQSTAELEAQRAEAEARIDDLDRSLSSIQRSLGSETEYYDVGALVVTPEEAASLPATSLYFPDDRFYALDVAQTTGWTYEVTTELKMTADLLGVTEDDLRAQGSEGQIDAMTRFPVHLWRLGDDRSISYLDPSGGQRFALHPRTEVSLQRVSHDDYLSVVEASLAEGDQSMESIRASFGRDPAGWVLQDQLALEIGGSRGLRARIDSLQKRDALAYARVETTLPDVQLEGEDRVLPEYYWSREWLLIGTDDDLYLAKLFVADDDHRSSDYGAMGSWLTAFRVLDS